MRDFKIKGYTVGQSPNAPLIFALVGLVVGWITDTGSAVNALARAVFYIGLTIWAYEELTEGVNGFRRILGAAGLLYVLISLASDLGL